MSKTWDKVKRGLAGAAPLLGTVLGGPGGGALGTLVAGALDVKDEPDAIAAAIEGASPEQIVQLKQLEMEHKAGIERLMVEQAIAKAKAEASKIESVNTTMRVETKAEDPWTRRWRPFWGYMSGTAFFILVCCIGYFVATAEASFLKELPGIITALAVLFSIPGAILGVSAWHRGVKQRVEAGEQKPLGIVAALASRLSK